MTLPVLMVPAVLCATSGELTGIDFPNVQITANVCIVEESKSDQWKGRCDHSSISGLHVVFYEPWVLDIKLTKFNNKDLPFNKDPDCPWTVLKAGSNK
ncbi:hypothetical protein BDP27DRAFT_1422646 [Rhodocollybia butyracea]|uniref:Uncharacterized protein n=1 Tax=Rhodocollybia butyracea TaxID=206335 RepID=A0A9P5PPI7_9AGAR|nr:hypothetical protein BDP27DRAFT_1422646 [Rhodocollybia butyracea]